ncbi:MAG: tetratricopeptide repeat protein, partial [Planctomycetota bacterium]
EAVLDENQKLMASVGQAFDAQFLLGQARLALKQPAEAASALKTALSANRDHPRHDEARILYGQALVETDEPRAKREAVKVWQSIIDDDANSGMAAQARYKLGQLALDQERLSDAIKFFASAAEQTSDPSLRPYAIYSLASTQLSLRRAPEAVDQLYSFESRFPNHPLTPQVQLTRGMAFRSLGRLEESKRDLKNFLGTNPSGEDLGDALYELSLISTSEKDYTSAAMYLSRVLQDVPDYSSMSKVLYELAWSLEEGGREKEGRRRFAQLVDQYPDHPLSADANYFLGQKLYAEADYPAAIERFNSVVGQSEDPSLVNKSLYRLGWSHYKIRRFEEASRLFDRQLQGDSEGPLSFDALMMSAECEFKAGRYREALEKFAKCRERIRRDDDRDSTLKVASKSRVRQLALLHAGQSAAQLGDFAMAIQWYDELRERFPSSDYLAQVFYESAFAYQQVGNDQRALKLYSEVAENYRSEIGARSRFMMGEIFFAKEQFEKAVPEFQRVMFGYGADQAPEAIKNWQAKSGFEAGKCCEVLQQRARTEAAKFKAKKIGLSFYRYVVEKHPTHELTEQAKERLNEWEED